MSNFSISRSATRTMASHASLNPRAASAGDAPMADRSSSVKSPLSNAPSSKNASTATPRADAARVTASRNVFASMAAGASSPALSRPAGVAICAAAETNSSMNRNSRICLNGVAPSCSGNEGTARNSVRMSFSRVIGKNLRCSETLCMIGSRAVATTAKPHPRSFKASRNASRCFSSMRIPGVLMWCAMTYAPLFPRSMDSKTWFVTLETFEAIVSASSPKPYTFRFEGKSSTYPSMPGWPGSVGVSLPVSSLYSTFASTPLVLTRSFRLRWNDVPPVNCTWSNHVAEHRALLYESWEDSRRDAERPGTPPRTCAERKRGTGGSEPRDSRARDARRGARGDSAARRSGCHLAARGLERLERLERLSHAARVHRKV